MNNTINTSFAKPPDCMPLSFIIKETEKEEKGGTSQKTGSVIINTTQITNEVLLDLFGENDEGNPEWLYELRKLKSDEEECIKKEESGFRPIRITGDYDDRDGD